MVHPLPRIVALLALLTVALPSLRAQITEVPETVAPGRFLLEMDALSMSLDREGSERATGIVFGSALVTTGLTANWDVQLGAQLFLSQKLTTRGASDRRSGVGDVYVRTKWRFLDDKTTGVSMAVLPYAKIPTNSGGVGNGALEGGVMLPFRYNLPVGLDFTAMTGVDFHRKDAGDGYDVAWHGAAEAGVQLTAKIGVYAEITISKNTGGQPWDGSMGAGLTFKIRPGLDWDFAVYRGVTSYAADWNPVVRCNIGF